MNPFARNYQKLKSINDYETLDRPGILYREDLNCSFRNQMVLRMLVRAKYGDFKIPEELRWLKPSILRLSMHDRSITGIEKSWCYITVRHGPVVSKTDDEWHFDGASFRTEIIPERNYIWVSHDPTEYKVGELNIPRDFDPVRHNLFKFASHQLEGQETRTTAPKTWFLVNPFCLHRRPENVTKGWRTFVRVCFTDIEGRDVNNTKNFLLETPAYGRDPVKTFRDKLESYYA